MNGTEIWLAITSALVSVIGVLATLGYKDISRRMKALETQDGKIVSALLILLMARSTDHDAIASAMHALITNGITKTG